MVESEYCGWQNDCKHSCLTFQHDWNFWNGKKCQSEFLTCFAYNQQKKSSWCQFHQHFTCGFLLQKFFAKLFCTFFYFRFELLLAKECRRKCAYKMLVKLTKAISFLSRSNRISCCDDDDEQKSNYDFQNQMCFAFIRLKKCQFPDYDRLRFKRELTLLMSSQKDVEAFARMSRYYSYSSISHLRNIAADSDVSNLYQSWPIFTHTRGQSYKTFRRLFRRLAQSS